MVVSPRVRVLTSLTRVRYEAIRVPLTALAPRHDIERLV